MLDGRPGTPLIASTSRDSDARNRIRFAEGER